jgi:hypothetical protein
MRKPKKQKKRLNDLSCSLAPFDPNHTLIGVIELSKKSWLVAGIIPGVERQPLKKLRADENQLLNVIAPCVPGRGLFPRHYAWKGGPRLKGEPGTPEFIASYNEAVMHKVSKPDGLMTSILRYYEPTSEFNSLAERTKEDYRKKIAPIENKFGDLPLAALADKRARGIFKEWCDELAKSSRRQADSTIFSQLERNSAQKDQINSFVFPTTLGTAADPRDARRLHWAEGGKPN